MHKPVVMHKQILLLLIVLLTLCADTHAQNLPKIKFVNRDSVYDYGSILSGDEPRYQFEIKNTGDTALLITDMTSETGDFKFEYPAKPLKPHKKELIFVTYLPKDPTVLGSFKSDIFITSNATTAPYPFIHISGTVLPTKDASATPRTPQSSRGGRGGR